jgi:hypothetical protein
MQVSIYVLRHILEQPVSSEEKIRKIRSLVYPLSGDRGVKQGQQSFFLGLEKKQRGTQMDNTQMLDDLHDF